MMPHEIFLNVDAFVGSGYSQRNDGAEVSVAVRKYPQVAKLRSPVLAS